MLKYCKNDFLQHRPTPTNVKEKYTHMIEEREKNKQINEWLQHGQTYVQSRDRKEAPTLQKNTLK